MLSKRARYEALREQLTRELNSALLLEYYDAARELYGCVPAEACDYVREVLSTVWGREAGRP